MSPRATTVVAVLSMLCLPLSSQAASITYLGAWNNTTFGSSGAVTLVYDDVAGEATVDLDGNVFGGSDPAPFVVNISPVTGGLAITLNDHPTFGDINGMADPASGFAMADITDVPGGFPFKTEVMGTFDASSINMSYTIFHPDASSFFAEGTIQAAAVVPLPASLLLLGLAVPLLWRRRQ